MGILQEMHLKLSSLGLHNAVIVSVFKSILKWPLLRIDLPCRILSASALLWFAQLLSSRRALFLLRAAAKQQVNRCLARYSPRATTTNQMSRQGLAQKEQKCHFRAKLGLFWAKNPNFYWRNQKFCHPHTENPPRHLVHIGFWSDIGQNVQKMAIFGPKWPKMQIFDQIWPFLGQKS